MFDGLVERYDLLNDVLSLGLDRAWRRATVRMVRPGPGDRVLDLGCGTGKMGLLISDRARVVGVDVSMAMLHAARRATGATAHPGGRGREASGSRSRPALVQGSAFRLPFRDRAFAAAVSGFVLRNLDDLPKALAELARVVRPGGMVSLVDITEPRHPVLRRLFDVYFGTVAPAVGSLVGKGPEYRYLVDSLAQLPPPDRMLGLLSEVGFEGPSARPLTGGMVTLFTAVRSPSGRAETAPGP